MNVQKTNLTQDSSAAPVKPTEQQAPARKEILYKLPKCKIGDGKAGPVELVIYNDELYAMKRVLKTSIDKPKRIQHLKGEKFILMLLKNLQEEILKKRRGDSEDRADDTAFKQKLHDDFNSMQNESTMGTSYRNSYLIDEA